MYKNVVQMNTEICYLKCLNVETFYSAYLLINIQMLEKPDTWEKVNESST
jgi:hypothetical protein